MQDCVSVYRKACLPYSSFEVGQICDTGNPIQGSNSLPDLWQRQTY